MTISETMRSIEGHRKSKQINRNQSRPFKTGGNA